MKRNQIFRNIRTNFDFRHYLQLDRLRLVRLPERALVHNLVVLHTTAAEDLLVVLCAAHVGVLLGLEQHFDLSDRRSKLPFRVK